MGKSEQASVSDEVVHSSNSMTVWYLHKVHGGCRCLHSKKFLLSVWLVLLSQQHLCGGVLQPVVAGTTAFVESPKAFVAALQDNSVTTINLSSSMSITQDVWMRGTASSKQHRVQVDRPLTVRGPAVGGAAVVMDLNFLKRRLMVTSDHIVTFENVVIRGCRQPSAISAAGLDFLSLRAGSIVMFKGVVFEYELCAPTAFSAMYAPAVSRPVDLPPVSASNATSAGKTQLVAVVHDYCIPGTSPPSCWPDALSMADFGIAGSTLNEAGVRVNLGSVLNLGSVYVCNHSMTLQCVLSNGMPACTQQAVSALGLEPLNSFDLVDPPMPGDAGGARLGIILPAVLGGVAAVALAVAAAALVVRRRRRRAADGAGLTSLQEVAVAVTAGGYDGARGHHPAPAKCQVPYSVVGSEAAKSIHDASEPTRSFTQSLAYAGSSTALASVVQPPSSVDACGPDDPASATHMPLGLVLGLDIAVDREAVLGRGTFSTVVKGSMNGRPVAVKLFHKDAVAGTAADLKAFRNELAILARLQHPNVVATLGAGSSASGAELFVVLELMEGGSLLRSCHAGTGLCLARALTIARDVAVGLSYLHPTCIHRDLKPANVLLDSKGEAKLADFGISRLWASTVHTVNPDAGTVQYMAPECFAHNFESNSAALRAPITHKSDIFSFGVLLWEMLAQDRPWRGLSAIQVALAVGYGKQRLKLPDGPEASRRFPPKLVKLIKQCWEEDPRQRPAAAEIVKRLTLLLQQLEAAGTPMDDTAGASMAAHEERGAPQRDDGAAGMGASRLQPASQQPEQGQMEPLEGGA